MQELRRVRLRDGATDWSLDRDLADSEHFVEQFHVRAWDEPLRQHERFTCADLPIEREIRELGAERVSRRSPTLSRSSVRGGSDELAASRLEDVVARAARRPFEVWNEHSRQPTTNPWSRINRRRRAPRLGLPGCSR